jgi:hypothetical protein
MYNYTLILKWILTFILEVAITGGTLLIIGLLALEGIKSFRKKITYKREI